MPRSRNKTNSDGESAIEAKIIDAIQRAKTKNVSLLSRITGVHAETIRYKIKKQFRQIGLRIIPGIDLRKVGLSLHWSTLKFSKEKGEKVSKILQRLNESCYLIYYGKVVPEGYYIAYFALPDGRASDFSSFLAHLKQIGILDSYRFNQIVMARKNPMKPIYFDFNEGDWIVNWDRVKDEQAISISAVEQKEVARADQYDLLLLKELQIDPLQHVVGIARKLRLHQKTLEYHYRAHVQKKGLIQSYIVRWEGAPNLGKEAITLRLIFTSLGSDLNRVQVIVNKIPFVWSEDLLDDGTYIATLKMPSKYLVETFKFMNDNLPDLNERVKIAFIEPSFEKAFTIPYNLFRDGWLLDLDEMKSIFNKLL